MMSEFYSIVQLLATLTIGFVILDYSDFFTNILKTKFFHADDAISEAKKECLSLIPDKTTLNALEPTTVGKGDTSNKIEVLKRECEKMDERIDGFEKDRKAEMDEMSDLRSLAPLCLFVFMFSVTLLFVPVLKRLYGESVCLSLFPFSVSCIVYMILGWIFGENADNPKITRFESMKHPLIGFALACLISVAFAFLLPNSPAWIGGTWRYLFVALILCGWLNFAVYAFIIKRSISKFKKKVGNEKGKIIQECKAIEEKYKAILTVSEMAKSYDAN